MSVFLFGVVFGVVVGGRLVDYNGWCKMILYFVILFFVFIIGCIILLNVVIMIFCCFLLGFVVGGVFVIVLIYLVEMLLVESWGKMVI